MGKKELVALLVLSSWCLIIGFWLILMLTWASLQCVIVVFPDHAHLFIFCCNSAGQAVQHIVGQESKIHVLDFHIFQLR